ncbi:MAG: hypothetical protein A2X94_08200 [Bdellovibrionales bacterium GWB1_55_8]|nr:MAG: hypothetical protein A2X94_08200 [Bdellovibrionales bacterium GWB1_55_8]
MPFSIESAYLADINELLKLYFVVYGNSYPLSYNDPKVMADTISSVDHNWLVARDKATGAIAGSVVFDLDPINKVGKVAALVVHPDYRKQSVGSTLVSVGGRDLISEAGPLNTLYTTTRTLSVGPQLTFLRDGYLPLGIFPNAHRLREFETTTLLAKFKPGVLERRRRPERIPRKLAKIYEVLHAQLGVTESQELTDRDEWTPAPAAPELEFELVFAPDYVLRRFNEAFKDPYDRFYPFHLPNLLMASKNGEVEIYAYFSKVDGYCAIVALDQPVYTLEGRLRGLLRLLRGFGVSYLEVLMGVEHTRSLETLLQSQFLPVAIYPAMREVDGAMHDFVVLSRTMEPLNFRGMEIEKRFKPYVAQYIELWKDMYLNTLEIFNERK